MGYPGSGQVTGSETEGIVLSSINLTQASDRVWSHAMAGRRCMGRTSI